MEVLYATYDVEPYLNLRLGDHGNDTHTIGVEVGNGWWNPLPLRFWGHDNVRTALTTGEPMFRLELRCVATAARSFVRLLLSVRVCVFPPLTDTISIYLYAYVLYSVSPSRCLFVCKQDRAFGRFNKGGQFKPLRLEGWRRV